MKLTVEYLSKMLNREITDEGEVLDDWSNVEFESAEYCREYSGSNGKHTILVKIVIAKGKSYENTLFAGESRLLYIIDNDVYDVDDFSEVLAYGLDCAEECNKKLEQNAVREELKGKSIIVKESKTSNNEVVYTSASTEDCLRNYEERLKACEKAGKVKGWLIMYSNLAEDIEVYLLSDTKNPAFYELECKSYTAVITRHEKKYKLYIPIATAATGKIITLTDNDMKRI